MRSTIIALASGIALISAGAALADPAPASAQPASAPRDPNQVICHTFVHEGVLIGKGECHTQHQWDAIQLREQDSIRQIQIRALEMHNN